MLQVMELMLLRILIIDGGHIRLIQLFPKAPNGVLVGGPNSGMQDPWVRDQAGSWEKERRQSAIWIILKHGL